MKKIFYIKIMNNILNILFDKFLKHKKKVFIKNISKFMCKRKLVIVTILKYFEVNMLL